MNDKIKISIITCTYNRFEKLKKNINSIKRQNYENYEHHILDDGSDDETQDYFNQISDKKIQYHRFDENIGQPGVLFYSQIFDHINGDYVIILDSDDYLFDGAIDIFLEYYRKHGEKYWNYAFDFSDEIQNSFEMKNTYTDSKFIITNSKDCFRDNYPRNLNNKGYRDFLNFRKKIFFDEIKKYFTSPEFWYSSLHEVGIYREFKEIFIYKKIYFMNFGSDSVTRGFNIKKYQNYTLISKERIFNKYKDLMDKNFFLYSLKSLILNYLVNKNCKKKLIKLSIKNFSFLFRNIDILIRIIFLFFIPHQVLLYLKMKIKFFKNSRK